MRMSKEERSELRRRLSHGRDHVRQRLHEELSKVDFRTLREKVRAAKQAGKLDSAKGSSAPVDPAIGDRTALDPSTEPGGRGDF